VPTISDRVAQTVVARRLEAKVEPIFHPDSYGYRPHRSALDAVAACRQRCWKTDWVIDLDIQKFFDSVDHSLMVKAVEAHADVPWVVLDVIPNNNYGSGGWARLVSGSRRRVSTVHSLDVKFCLQIVPSPVRPEEGDRCWDVVPESTVY